MIRKLLLPSLFTTLALIGLSRFCAADAPGLAESKGWCVILATNSAQSDAIFACHFAVARLQVPTDHIILLAEGPRIDQFAAQGTYAQLDPPVGEPAEMKAGWFDKQVRNTQEHAEGLTTAFGETGFQTAGGSLPLRGEPTAANFRAARDLIAARAEKGQFIALFVSADPAKSPDFLAMTKPVAGSDSAANGLKASDFQFTNCKANARFLFIDASNTGENKLCATDEEQKAAAKLDAKDSGVFDLRKYLAPNNEPALVLSAAGSKAGSHHYYSGGRFWDAGRLMYGLDSVSEDDWAEQTIGECLNQVCDNAFMDRSPQTPRLYASAGIVGASLDAALTADFAPARAVAQTAPAQGKAAIIITPEQVGAGLKTNPAAIATPSPEQLGVVTLKDNKGITHNYGYLTPIRRGDSRKPEAAMSSQERAEIISGRIKALVHLGKIQKSDLKAGIDEATGLWVVKCPLIPEGHIITADPEFAHHRNSKSPEALANSLSDELYAALTSQTALQHMLGGTPGDLYQSGIEAADKGEWPEAAKRFQQALDKSSRFTNAYIALCNVQIKMDKRDAARRTFQQMLDRGRRPEGEQIDQVEKLRKQLR